MPLKRPLPTQRQLCAHLMAAGLLAGGLAHQSNGQALPLSRSWNRTYLMGAAEKVLGQESSLMRQGRVWRRLRESSGNDDSLLDYNRKRQMLSVGMRLVDG